MNKKKSVWVFSQDESYPERGSLVRHYFLGRHYEHIDLTIFCSNNSHFLTNPPTFKGSFFIEKKDGIRFCWVNLPKYRRDKTKGGKRIFSWILFMIKLFSIPLKKLSKPDTIIVSSFPILPIINALYYKYRFRNTKVILEIRDIYPLTLIELGGYSKYNPLIILLRLIEKVSYRKADHIVSVLSNAEEHIKRSITSPFKFKWICNGISEIVIKNKEPLNSIYNMKFPNKGFNICYAGSLGHAYALESLLLAGIKLKDSNVNVIFLGDGPEKASLVEQSKTSSNIFFFPKVKKLEVQSFLEKCDALYLGWKTSKLWQYGIASNKLFDYMYAAKPIVAACDFENKIINDSGCGYTIRSEDSDALAEAICKLQQMSVDKRLQIGQKGKNYLLENLSYNHLAKEYEEII